MRISIQKRADGGAVLRCTRADGSVTWQKQEGTRAAFFPRHDLTHFAVETVLGVRRAFFGLVSEGWEIPDTEGKGPRGPVTDEELIRICTLTGDLVGAWTRLLPGGTPDLTFGTGSP